MPVRSASAVWNGTLKEGAGRMRLGGGAYEGPYSYSSRFEDGPGTNPEELVAAAHAGCFSMFLAAQLTNAGSPPSEVRTTAKVHLNEGRINIVELETEASVPGISDEAFQKHVEKSRTDCPISRTLAATEIRAQAKLSAS